MAEPVGTIRRDLDFKYLLCWKKLRERRANDCIWRQDQQAHITLGPLAKSQFLGAAHHPLALDASQFANLDLEVARHHGSGEGKRNLVAHFVVLRSADDLA